MKKMWLLATILLALPLVSAAGPLEFIGGIWDKILMIGGLSFLQGFGLVAFTRILIWILTFALLFAVAAVLGRRKDGTPLFSRSQAMMVGAVLATISAVFLPATAILAVGAGWATAVGLILIGAPVVGLFYVLWNIPSDKDGKSLPDTKGTVLLKLLISMLLFWILSAMNSSLVNERGVDIGQASVAGTMANFIAWALYIASIMIIYYIIKFFFTSSEGAEEADKKWKESGAALGKWIGKKADAQKAKEEMDRREQGVKEPKSYLINAVDAGEGLLAVLYRSARTPEERKVAVDKAEKHLRLLKKNLKKAVRSLRYLRRKEKGDIYEFFDSAYSQAGVALSAARNISLPKPTSENWENGLAAIRGQVKGRIRPTCGNIMKHLDAFVEHQQTQLSQIEASQRVGQQAEQQEQQEAARELAGRKLEGQRLEGRTLGRRTRLEPRGAVRKTRPQKK
ncbi:MAG: hypothetical protein Q8R47_01650 [Nanoarchaeota archaeon]|nr:hypothetical protein [Nanoarchaeota archaeon]